jgi:hypothetical protein
MARTEYKMIVIRKKEICSTIYNGACLPGFVSRHTISHKAAVASLSHRWLLIRPHPVRQQKGRMCIVSPFDGVEAAHPDLWYPSFSMTKLRRSRAFATCSLPQYGQIPAAGALLVTSR